MKSLVFRTATRYLWPLLMLFSVYLLVEGHHRPGGGFVGGLMAAAAISLCSLAFDVTVARRIFIVEPPRVMGLGLLTMAASGVVAVATGKPFLTGVWISIPWPGRGSLDLGTPLLFDVGVFLAVVGVTVTVLFTLAEEQE